MNIRFVNRTDSKTSGPMPLKFNLEKGKSEIFEASLSVENFEKLQTVSGEVIYSIGESKNNLAFKLPLPSSFFFFEKEILIENFSKLAKDLQFSSKKKLQYTETIKDIQMVSTEIAKILHLNTVSVNSI
jgi:hypothetical protein